MSSGESLSETERSRFDAEWMLTNALREGMRLASNEVEPITYRQALNLGGQVAPSVFLSHNRIIDNPPESIHTRLIREKAAAQSKVNGTHISAFDYVNAEIAVIKKQIEAHPDGELLKGNLDRLEIVHQELKPRTHTEHQLIFGDAFASGRDLPWTGTGKGYKDYRLDAQRILRVRVLHPDPPEHKIGADLIYETLDANRQTARLAIIQYKMWDGHDFHQDPRMLNQLARLKTFACKNLSCQLCSANYDPKPTYRLPSCAVFIRPTDRLQHPNANMKSSGLHIPLCVVESSWEVNQRQGLTIRRPAVVDRSLSHRVFDELFKSHMVGSKEITWPELTAIYKMYDIFDAEDRIILHMQDSAMI